MKNFCVPEHAVMDFEFYDNKKVQMHFHQNVELFFLLEGKGTLFLDEGEITLDTGSYFVVNANRRHAFEAEEDVLYICLHINFNILNFYIDMNRVIFMCDSNAVKHDTDKKIRDSLTKMINCYFAKSGTGQVHLTTFYYELLDILLNSCVVYGDDERFSSRKSAEQDRLNRIVNYVYSNYHNEISLNDLADQLFLSTTYLSKYIKDRLGMNFTDYVNNIRLYHAVEEVRGTDKKMTHIAMDNGFPNITAFNKAFKKIYDMTPMEFREREKHDHEKAGNDVAKNAQISKKARSYLKNQEEQHRIPEGAEQEIQYVFADAYEQSVYNKYWNKLINIGYMSDLLLSDSQQHVVFLKEKLHFEYVRFWDIYGEALHLNIAEHGESYNFGTMDKVFDFLHQNGIYPYIELGFKPLMLVESLDGFLVSKEREILFQSAEEYDAFLRAFLKHYANRYGIEEVEKWKFEQWKDTRLTDNNFQGYFELFETAYQAVKSVSPNIQIGGGSIHRSYDEPIVENLLVQWKKRMMYPDFITIYSYPYKTGDAGQAIDRRRSQNPDYLREQIETVRDILTRIGMHVKELHVTEWSMTVSNRNPMNDSCYKGAYVMKNIMDNMGKADMLGYWLGSDIFSQHSDTTGILNGGVGLLSRDGIKKPSCFAYEFMNHMGKYMIGKTENTLVTSNGKDNYFIAAHNYKQPSYKYYTIPENEINIQEMEQYFDDLKEKEISCQIKNVRNGSYRVRVEKINVLEGSALDEWIRLGKFNSLTVTDVEYLRQISIPKVNMWECRVTDSVLNFESVLNANEIQYIQLTYCF